jgi:hypothetical protein
MNPQRWSSTGTAVLLSVLAGSAAHAQPVQWQTIARSGQAAPGVANASFESVSDVRISASGVIAFRATLIGTGITAETDGTLWRVEGGPPALAYREGTPIAGTTAILRGLSTVNLSAAGAIGFAGGLSEVTLTNPTAPHNVGYFLEAAGLPGAAALIAREEGTTYTYSTHISIHADAAAWSLGPTLHTRAGLVLDTTTPVPGQPFVSFRNFSAPALGPQGEVAFRAAFGADATTANWHYALFRHDGTLAILAQTASPAAGLPDGTVYAELGMSPVIGAGGQVAAWARFQGPGVTPGRDTGLFLSTAGGPLLPLVKAGDPVADIEGATFASFSRNPAVSTSASSSAVVFLAHLDGATPLADNAGIFIVEPGVPPRLLARRGGHLNGMPHGTVLNLLGEPRMGGDNKVAFTAYLKGPGVTGTSNYALFGWDARVRPTMLLRTGTMFQIPGGPPKVVRDIGFDTEPESTGRTQISGRTMAIKLTFTDNSQGLFTATLPCIEDFDGDCDAGTDADIEAFFACIGGQCCAACGSADFDGDGDVATDADIEAFFRVLAGGQC